MTPLFGGGSEGRDEVFVFEDATVERRRSQAHRATATRPRTQIKAQRRAARMTTKSESTVGESGAESAVDDEFTPPNNLNGRVM